MRRASGPSILDIGFDDFRRPRIVLPAGTSDAPPHAVLLERLRPVVEGFCVTCFEDHLGFDQLAVRKARSCSLMVAYLIAVNRDRAMLRRLEQELRRIEELERLLVT